MAEPDNVMVSIQRLAHEEHDLLEREGRGEISEEDISRLRAIELQLDQCWDLLRQRRAREEVGLEPREARARDVETVEHYQQ